MYLLFIYSIPVVYTEYADLSGDQEMWIEVPGNYIRRNNFEVSTVSVHSADILETTIVSLLKSELHGSTTVLNSQALTGWYTQWYGVHLTIARWGIVPTISDVMTISYNEKVPGISYHVRHTPCHGRVPSPNNHCRRALRDHTGSAETAVKRPCLLFILWTERSSDFGVDREIIWPTQTNEDSVLPRTPANDAVLVGNNQGPKIQQE